MVNIKKKKKKEKKKSLIGKQNYFLLLSDLFSINLITIFCHVSKVIFKIYNTLVFLDTQNYALRWRVHTLTSFGILFKLYVIFLGIIYWKPEACWSMHPLHLKIWCCVSKSTCLSYVSSITFDLWRNTVTHLLKTHGKSPGKITVSSASVRLIFLSISLKTKPRNLKRKTLKISITLITTSLCFMVVS